MSDVLSRISSHFASLGVRKIEVPEWELTVHASPVTIAERNRIYAGSKGDNDYELVIRTVLEKACDADGKKLFTLADKATLLQKADSKILIRLAAEILSGGDAPGVDELKNS